MLSRMAPAGTPSEIVGKLHGESKRGMQLAEVATKLTQPGVRRAAMSVEKFSQFIATEVATYRDLAMRTGVRME